MDSPSFKGNGGATDGLSADGAADSPSFKGNGGATDGLSADGAADSPDVNY